MEADRVFRFVLKVAQLLLTGFLLFAIGFPYWMVVAAALLVPIYGFYLMLRSPDQTEASSPYASFKRTRLAASWKKVDIALCVTMAIVCCIFALILFFFYIKIDSISSYVAYSATAALGLAFLYALNGFLVLRQLHRGTVDFQREPKLFATANSRSSPLTTKPTNDKAMDFFGGTQHSEALNKVQETPLRTPVKVQIDQAERNSLPTPDAPVLEARMNVFSASDKPALMRQISSERAFGQRRVTSWFTDMGEGKKESIVPLDVVKGGTKDDLDAREQYIKSKQYRDFMDPTPNSSKKSLSKRSSTRLDEQMENFNEKFSASDGGIESGSVHTGTLGSLTSKANYRVTTTPYVRKPMPSESGIDAKGERRLSNSHYQRPGAVPTKAMFSISQSSRDSRCSSQSELERVFAPRPFQERPIDVGSYRASPARVSDSPVTLQSLEATPKALRPSSGRFDDSSMSHRSIGVDDDPGTAMKVFATAGPLHEYADPTKRWSEPLKGRVVLTGVARPFSHQENGRIPEQEDSGSLPSRSVSSLSDIKEHDEPVQQMPTVASPSDSSTVRMDDVDRPYVRSPLHDKSLMTTSTIVTMNSPPHSRDRSPAIMVPLATHIDSRREATLPLTHTASRGVKKASIQRRVPGKDPPEFDVVIRPRESPTDSRPQSVAVTTEFPPAYNAASTTLRIRTPTTEYSQYRHSTTHF